MSEHADRFTAVLDTDVLVGVLTRNVLLSFAREGFFRARWSSVTLDFEFDRAFAKARPDEAWKGPEQRARVEAIFPEGRVDVAPEELEGLDLTDPDDRHVLAAAIRTKAAVIVTNNLRDFPADRLAKFEVDARSADEFVADCIDLYHGAALAALRRMRLRFVRNPLDAEGLLRSLERVGLMQTATLLAPFRGSL